MSADHNIIAAAVAWIAANTGFTWRAYAKARDAEATASQTRESLNRLANRAERQRQEDREVHSKTFDTLTALREQVARIEAMLRVQGRD